MIVKSVTGSEVEYRSGIIRAVYQRADDFLEVWYPMMTEPDIIVVEHRITLKLMTDSGELLQDFKK